MNFTINNISGQISMSDDYRYCVIKAIITEEVKNKQLSYIAAKPPHRIASYYGSGHPFPNMSVAFEETQTKGIINLNDKNEFELFFEIPNSYYVHLGSFLIQPIIYISYNNGFVQKNERIYIGEGIQYRTLTYPEERRNENFYGSLQGLPVRSQEQILIDGKYEINKQKSTFWDLKPPV